MSTETNEPKTPDRFESARKEQRGLNSVCKRENLAAFRCELERS